MGTRHYSVKLNSNTQITAEEQISAMIRSAIEESEDADGQHDYTLTDEDCADLGRAILKVVLLKFRPDLFDKAPFKSKRVTGQDGFTHCRNCGAEWLPGHECKG